MDPDGLEIRRTFSKIPFGLRSGFRILEELEDWNCLMP